MFNVLDRLHHTAEGADGLPAWFLRLSAPSFSGILAHLVNKSLDCSVVPLQWKTAMIRPKAKVAVPRSPADYRPISVLPVLSRVVGRFIVRNYLYPSFEELTPPLSLSHQFAFRPSGSTTAAVIAVQHNITEMLAENEYAITISTDYSKAFDSISHDAISEALSGLDIQDEIYNWHEEYLENKRHFTACGVQISSVAVINASMVQDSVIGPSDFIVGITDLKPVSSLNRLMKYCADDSYLLIGSRNVHSTQDELNHISSWATSKHLHLNPTKAREMVVVRRNRPSMAAEPPIAGGSRSSTMNILSITIVIVIVIVNS